MSVLGLLGLGAILIGSEIATSSKRSRMTANALARGAYRPSNDKFDMYVQDAYDDWKSEKKLFPKEYRKYLARNPDARREYMFALVSKREVDEGYYPTCIVGTFDCSTFDPFAGFNHRYLEKIKIFNETGKLYY